jgi:pimeloyl-ACP methyl ester carboxylesterase
MNNVPSSLAEALALVVWRRLRFWILLAVGIYSCLAAASYVIRRRAGDPELSPGEREVQVQAFDGAGRTGRSVRIAYNEFCGSGCQNRPVVLLVHGSPGHKEDFKRIAPGLAGTYRVIVPDLPGFGHSTHDLPAYSFRAHADYLLQMMDKLGIRRFHLVGFSMGGGVVLEIADHAPERVASVTMLSAIGVQDMELLGDYYLNHGIHAAQLVFLWLLQSTYPSPEFQRDAIAVSYARNFYDSDQRPLRGILNRYAEPMQILHGQGDILVPVEAALEHHRLVPQSEIHLFPESHFMVFDQEAPQISRAIGEFAGRVEAGQVQTRATADPQRIRAAAQPFHRQRGPRAMAVTAAVFVMILAAMAAANEHIGYILAGLVFGLGRLGLPAVFLASLAGALAMLSALMILGRLFGRKAPIQWPPVEPSSFRKHLRICAPVLGNYLVAGATLAGWKASVGFWWREAGGIALAACVYTAASAGLFRAMLSWQGVRDILTLRNAALALLVIWLVRLAMYRLKTAKG